MLTQTPSPELNPVQIIPMLLFWIGFGALLVILLRKQKLNTKLIIILLLITFFFAGIVLGAFPNPVAPVQQIIQKIQLNQTLKTIVPMILILIILLGTGALFGRLFCGYLCPLGAIQELMSKINFKSNLKDQKKTKKYRIDITKKTSNIIRWMLFIGIIIGSIFWSISVIQFANVFNGFQIFKNPAAPMVLIPSIFMIIVIVLSIFIYRPYCRLVCPFGTLVSETSRFAFFKIRRNEKCTECGICEKICPTQEAGRDDTKKECYLCNRCIELCPSNALEYRK
jgi:polyferredoxin